MTDPMDTDALRALIREDRSVRLLRMQRGLLAAADELDRLRATIKTAPHDQSCNLGLMGSYGRPLDCDCWKADAL